ncbi:MAG: hypothetical protein ACOC0P_03350 [Planctomycetota bacterium]
MTRKTMHKHTRRSRTAAHRSRAAVAIAASAALFACAAASTYAAPPTYYLTDLGDLGGEGTFARDVNDFAEVVGWGYDNFDRQRAFLWRNGEMIDLGVLPGETESVATGINNLGQIVGYSGDRGFYWEDGIMTEMPTFDGGGRVVPEDISDAGRACGYAFDSNGVYKGFWWDASQGWDFLFELTVPSGITRHAARAINFNRFTAMDGDGGSFPTDSWRAYYSTYADVPDTGGSDYSLDINFSGWMTGHRYDSGGFADGFLWKSTSNVTTITPVFGYTDQFQYGINDDGDCVGFSRLLTGGFTFDFEATIYLEDENTNYRLEPYVTNLGAWDLEAGRAINDRGQIVGTGEIGGSTENRSFLLTPVPDEGFVFLPNDVDDVVYVIEPRNGTPLGSFDVSSFATGPFELIDGNNGALLLSDRTADNIWELTVWGANLGAFNNAPVNEIRGIDRSLAGYIVGTTNSGFKAWQSNGNEVATGLNGDFWDVWFLNFPNVKRYLVSDVVSDNVESYDLDVIPRGQTTAGQMDFPEQIAPMTSLRFAVASHSDGRIYIFNLRNGNLISSFPVDGAPRGVYQSSESVLLVTTTTGVYQYFTSGSLYREIMTGSGFRYLSQCRNYNPL